MKRTLCLLLMLMLLSAGAWAQTAYVNELGSTSGWLSDDTRGETGTDLVGLTLTHYGKPGQTPTAADDIAIGQHISFVQGPDNVGAVKMDKTSVAGGYSKCTISQIDENGFATDDNWLSGFVCNYRYYTNSSAEVTVIKIGIQSTDWGSGAGESQNGFTATRSGESAWDLILVDWRGTNPPWTVGSWDILNTDKDTECWRIYRQGGNSFFPATPSVDMSLQDIYDDAYWGPKIFGAGAKVTSIQFGVGSSAQTSTSYIDYFETNLLNGGDPIDFVGPVHNVTRNSYFNDIQSAINDATTQDGDVIEVAAGTYTPTTTLTVNKELTITGAGSATTTIDVGGYNAWGIYIPANNVTFEGFTVQGNPTVNEQFALKAGTGNSGAGSHINTGLELNDIIIQGTKRTGLDLNGVSGAILTDITSTGATSGFGFSISSSEDITISDLTTSGNAWGDVGIFPANSPYQFPGLEVPADIVFQGTIDLSSGDGSISVQDGPLQYSGGTWTGTISNDPGDNADVTVPSGFNLIVNATRNADGLVLHNVGLRTAIINTAVALANSGAFSALTLFDIDNGDWEVIDELNIQDAIDAASANDMIHIYPGTYDETASGRYLYNASGPYQFGLFLGQDKPGITLQGVDASGNDITDYTTVVASITTNATNSFGYSGVFVEADDITIQGLEFLQNIPGDNKTLEILGDNLTYKYNIMGLDYGGSLYFNDWRYEASGPLSHLESFTIEGNLFKYGGSIDISSGVGVTGAVADRKILNNDFTGDGNAPYWAQISFNGTVPSVGWFVDPVGGAIITGNSFDAEITIPIRSRGTVEEDDFNWVSYWEDNDYVKAVVAWDVAAQKPRSYSYTVSSYTFNNVRRIGSVIQEEIDNAISGDQVRVAAGTYNENLNIGIPILLTSVSGASSTTISGSAGSPVIGIASSGVEINGFTITNPAGKYGITAQNYSNLIIRNNIITDIGSSDPSASGTNWGIAIVSTSSAVDNVLIEDNQVSYIHGGDFKSADGIGVGWSTGANDITNLVIQDNVISHITSSINPDYYAGGRGAYGIILNHARPGQAGRTVAPQILNNTISYLEGLWCHGIGLEGNTPNAVVQGNYIHHLTDYKSPADPDAVCIMVEDNLSANTVDIYHNKFEDAWLGIRNATNLSVDAEQNYWGTLDAAGVAALIYEPGGGAVDYDPWCNEDFTVCVYTATPGNNVYNEGNSTYYTDLQTAIDAASNGDEILVLNDGTYGGVIFEEGVTMEVTNVSGATVTIVGASPALTVLSGSVTYDGFNFITSTDDPTILIDGGDLTLRNCTITETAGGTQACIEMTSGNLDAGTSSIAGHNTFVLNGPGVALVNNSTNTAEAIANYWGTILESDVDDRITGPGTTNYAPWCNATFTMCGDDGGPITYAQKLIRPAGSVVVPVRVTNFNDVNSVSLKLTYDDTQLTYTSAAMGPDVPSGSLYADAAGGVVTVSFTPDAAFSLDDDDTIVEVTFDYLATATANLTWQDDATSAWLEYSYGDPATPYYDYQTSIYYLPGYVTNGSLTFDRTYVADTYPLTPTDQEIGAIVTGGTSPYSYAWVGPNGATYTGQYINPDDGYGDYYVTVTDDDGATIYGTYHFDRVHNIISMLDYHYINDAIVASETYNGDIILADPGLYQELATSLTKELDIRGPNYNVNPNADPTIRDSEAIIMQPDGTPDTYIYLHITADNVSFNGFTFEGDNPDITGTLDAAKAIVVNNSNNVELKYNIIQNYWRAGIDADGNVSGVNTGIQIANNRILNSLGKGPGYGSAIYFGGNTTGTIDGNHILNSRRCIFFDYNFNGGTVSITDNVLDATLIGIFVNRLSQFGASTVNIDGNSITSSETDVVAFNASIYTGILFATTWQYANNAISADNNTISGKFNYGIVGWNNADPITLTGGSIDGSLMQCGVKHEAVNGAYGNIYTGGGGALILDGVSISNAPTGVWTNDNGTGVSYNYVITSLVNGTSISGGTTGLKINGSTAGSTAKLDGNTLNNTVFSGQSGNYIELENNGEDIDATLASFDGVTGATATLAQNFGIEDKIVHEIDDASLGFVLVKANHTFVTINSYTSTTLTPDIQRAIDAAGATGWTVNVDAGTYYNNLAVDKSVLIAGAGIGSTIVIPAVSAPMPGAGGSLPAGASNVFLVQADDVTIQHLTVDGDNPGINSGVLSGSADVDARNGIITDHTAGTFNGLNVNNVEIQNIYLRGIYASTGGTFNFFENEVDNVAGEAQSIAMMNWAGVGTITDNTVTNSNDGIVSNWSSGTTYSGNNVSNCGSGIHTDNNGTTADQIFGNTVSDCEYGIFVFAPYVAAQVYENTVSNCDVGLGAFRSNGTTAPQVKFMRNTVNAPTTGTAVYFSNDGLGWGSEDCSVLFENNYVIGGTNSFFLESHTGYDLTVIANNNSVTGSSSGMSTSLAGTQTLDFNCNWWGFNVFDDIYPYVSTDVDYIPWLSDGIDNEPGTTGFQPVPGSCDGNPLISGTLKYNNATKEPMNGVTLTLSGGSLTTPVDAVTDASGNYTFDDIDIEPSTFTITVTDLKTPGSINSTDAAQVNQWAVSPYSIEYVKFLAGDANDSYTFTSNDAQRIQQQFVFGSGYILGDLWSYWKAGDTKSDNTLEDPLRSSIEVTLTDANLSQNLYGQVTGDFNSSYIWSAFKGVAAQVMLTYGNTLQVNADVETELALKMVRPEEIAAASLILEFPSELMEVTGVTMTENVGQLNWAVNGNELRLGWNNPSAISFEAGETLFNIQLRTSAGFVSGEVIQLMVVPDPMNELADGSLKTIPDAELSVDVLESNTFGIDDPSMAGNLVLKAAPNPFGSHTMLTYAVPVNGHVTLQITNMFGMTVATLADDLMTSGTYTMKMDALDLPAGIYTATIRLDSSERDMVTTIKLVINR